MDPAESSAAIVDDDSSSCVKTACRTDAGSCTSHLLLDAGTRTTAVSSLTATSSSSSIGSPPAPPPPSPIPARQSAAGRRKSSTSSIHKSASPLPPDESDSCSLIHDSHAPSSQFHLPHDPCSSGTGSSRRSVPDVASTQRAGHVMPDTPPDQDDEERDEKSDDQKLIQDKLAYFQNLAEETCKSLTSHKQQQSMSPAAAASKIEDVQPAFRSSSQPDVIAATRESGKHAAESGTAAVADSYSSSPAPTRTKASASSENICEKVTEEEKDEKGIYRLKWIECKKIGSEKEKDRIAIITQNENGPCPLIAIMNVLMLKGDLRVPKVMDVITADQLMEFLGDCILSNMPKNLSNGAQLNYEQNMMDAIAILPKLQTGLDVNVRFTSVTDFEFTPELIVFDLLRIPLYHGWLVDPVVDVEAAAAIGSCSYNQLVDKIINNKCSEKTSLVTEALQAEQFLESTATQLTYYGLEELLSHVNQEEPCVLFRNNHFITLLKKKNQLYQLVTDQGFLNESNVIWETLSNIEGDGEFVDQEFVLVPPKKISSSSMEFMSAEEVKQQEDQDYLLALSLQEEYKKELEQLKEWERDKAESGMVELSDEELARRLQHEEEEKHKQQQQQQAHASSSKTPTASHHHSQQQQQTLHHQMRNLKIVDSSSSSRINEGRGGSSGGGQYHPSESRQEDHSGSRSGIGTSHHHVQHDQRDAVMSDVSRNQLVRPSSGQSVSRRRTSSDSFATESHNRRSPAAGRASHSDGGGGGSSDSCSDGHRSDHRRNKSSCLLQ